MERLTTNKNVSDMGIVELALNCCYIAKDGSGRYRDYEIDIDERDFVRKLTTTLVGEDLSLQDESFDEEMMDNLGIDPFADVRGLIAIFYRNMWAMAELREKLKRYEDAEEQGLLLRLPCGIGTDIYYIPSEKNFRLNLLDGHVEENRVFHQTVDRITFRKNGWYMECDSDLEYGTGRILLDTSYGVTWFLTSDEAEAKLKDMEDSHDGE